MYTEIFRITKSVWPLVIMHTMEDAVINPLRLLGFISVEKKSSFSLLASSGDDSDYSLFKSWSSYTEMEKKTGVWKVELTK